ncbi:unnamed protein product [Chrysodeixis includens]|uniref:Uncharacterized protein n=1 Tax=Chrysodeixis includens TaxID=689277 RepID=A0A9P0FNY6_CHRIL|nr:unnamed protein product [Chrysodeixis includens]
MLKIVVLSFLALLLVSVTSTPLVPRDTFEVINLEEPCVRQGGICVRNEDCEPNNLVTLHVDLCPVQRHKGVSCCYL